MKRRKNEAPRPLMIQPNLHFGSFFSFKFILIDAIWLCRTLSHPTTPIFQTNIIFIIKLISHLVIFTIESNEWCLLPADMPMEAISFRNNKLISGPHMSYRSQ